MNAQDISDLIDADISDKWLEIIADICRGESSADTDSNNAAKLRDEFLSMQKFIEDKNEYSLDAHFPSLEKFLFGSAMWWHQKNEREL